MSTTYFCFSDECGDYYQYRSQKQLLNHPFYVRSTLIINSAEWKMINKRFFELKQKYNIPNGEIKWANLWSLKKCQESGKEITQKSGLKHLENIEYGRIIDFVEESLSLLDELDSLNIIITYTKNSAVSAIGEKSLLAFHLQEHMQRIEMELQANNNNLGVLFFDPVSPVKNEMFREIYNDLYNNGDFISKYKCIKDSLNIENSHHSVGIQLADFVSGAFSALLKFSSDGKHERGTKMFFASVLPHLRKNSNNIIHGYGIREVPKSHLTRLWITERITDYQKKNLINSN